MAISRADAARAPSVSAMATLDRMFIVRAQEEAGDASLIGSDEIAAARDRVAAEVQEQNTALDALSAQLGG